MKNPKSKRSHNVIVGIIALALLVAIVLGGTLAMRDYNQHKTNVLTSSGEELNVTLNENFEPPTDGDWKQGQEVTKEINVSNHGSSPAYIRITLTEYLELTWLTYEYWQESDPEIGRSANDTDVRFLTYPANHPEQGEYVRYPVADYNFVEVVAQFTAVAGGYLNLKGETIADRVVGPLTNALDKDDPDALYWYLQTFYDDPNGQYGKYLVKEIIEDPELVAGNDYWVNKPDTYEDFFDDDDRDEFNQIPKDTFEYNEFDYYRDDVDARKFVTVNFGADVISLDSWLIMTQAQKDAFFGWIYDEGPAYFYWSQPLQPDDATSLLVDSLTLIKRPEARLFYSLNASLDAVLFDQLNEWEFANFDIREYWGYSCNCADVDSCECAEGCGCTTCGCDECIITGGPSGPSGPTNAEIGKGSNQSNFTALTTLNGSGNNWNIMIYDNDGNVIDYLHSVSVNNTYKTANKTHVLVIDGSKYSRYGLNNTYQFTYTLGTSQEFIIVPPATTPVTVIILP